MLYFGDGNEHDAHLVGVPLKVRGCMWLLLLTVGDRGRKRKKEREREVLHACALLLFYIKKNKKNKIIFFCLLFNFFYNNGTL